MRRFPWRLRSVASGAKSSTATATTATADPSPERSPQGGGSYVGRFAPSPSGLLHLGSLYTAVASYLDARANRGRWLVRMEDLDGPRVVAGSASAILATLQRLGFQWDAECVSQSSRIDRYAAALDALRGRNLTFECACSRSQLNDAERYPGYCRARPAAAGTTTAIRLRIDPGLIHFTDRIQGMFRQDVAAAVGDVVVRRRDRVIAYVLAVVVDDAEQGITHVVRGADLLDNTPRQIYLQQVLGLGSPCYAHVPVLTEPGGRKLAKSDRSVSVEGTTSPLLSVFALLGLAPPAELSDATLAEAWEWAIERWNIDRVPKRLSVHLSG